MLSIQTIWDGLRQKTISRYCPFKGTVSRKNLMGICILAQEVQTSIFIFYLTLEQKVLSAYLENALNHEKSIETYPTRLMLEQQHKNCRSFVSTLDRMDGAKSISRDCLFMGSIKKYWQTFFPIQLQAEDILVQTPAKYIITY